MRVRPTRSRPGRLRCSSSDVGAAGNDAADDALGSARSGSQAGNEVASQVPDTYRRAGTPGQGAITIRAPGRGVVVMSVGAKRQGSPPRVAGLRELRDRRSLSMPAPVAKGARCPYPNDRTIRPPGTHVATTSPPVRGHSETLAQARVLSSEAVLSTSATFYCPAPVRRRVTAESSAALDCARRPERALSTDIDDHVRPIDTDAHRSARWSSPIRTRSSKPTRCLEAMHRQPARPDSTSTGVTVTGGAARFASTAQTVNATRLRRHSRTLAADVGVYLASRLGRCGR